MTLVNAITIAALLTILAFAMLPVRAATLLVLLGGWALLPVGVYPPDRADAFPWWLIGTALPSDMMITKAWIAPALATVGILATCTRRLDAPAVVPADGLIALWCLSPLMHQGTGSPAAALACLYLFGSWGLPWMLGRWLFADDAGRLAVVRAIVCSGLVLAPFAVVEGTTGGFAYQALYGRQPFIADGAVRYVGFRPQLLFEHGNQYALWMAAVALSAAWLWHRSRTREGAVIACTLVALSIASQSVGAIALLAATLLIMKARIRTALANVLPLIVAALLVIAALHLSGLIPLERIARDTGAGRFALDALDAVGRRSIAWRISQDVRVLGSLQGYLLFGTGNWAWFEPNKTRPWGLPMLAIGQYGLFAFGFVMVSLAQPVWRVLRGTMMFRTRDPSFIAALIVLLAAGDALLNSFIFFPALVLAGSIADPRQDRTVRPLLKVAGGPDAAENADRKFIGKARARLLSL